MLDVEAIEAATEAARGNIGVELEKFAENTLEYIQREAKLTFEPILLPPLRTEIKGRHALVVVRGHDYRSDLAALKPYLREYQPVLIGVDGGADALLEIGFKPDIIIGDFDSVSDRALRCGAELIHHVHLDGRAPGRENLLEWGVAVRGVRDRRHQRGRRDAPGVRGRGEADRRGGNARDDGGVPRQGPEGDVVDVPHPAPARARCSSTRRV